MTGDSGKEEGMVERLTRLADQCRERMLAIICLTAIAMVAMGRLGDPENIVINVIVAISAFVSGVAVGKGSVRQGDEK